MEEKGIIEKDDISLRRILLFSWPIMLANMLQITFNFADTLVVGNYVSKQGLAAVGTTAPILIFFTWGLYGLSLGSNVLVSRMIGARQYDRISRTVFSSMCVGILWGSCIAVFGFFFAGNILKILSVPSDILSDATLYMRIYFLACPALGIYDFGSSIMRASGNTKDPTRFLAISGVMNVVLNLVFVAFLSFGVFGAALATVITQYLSAFLILRKLLKDDSSIRLLIDRDLFDLEIIGKILRYGIPSALQNQLFSFSNMMIQSSVNSFGSTFVAANTAANAIEEYVYVFVDAFPLASLTFSSKLFGARRYKDIFKETLQIFLVCGTGALLIGLFILMNGERFLSLLSIDPQVISFGLYRLRYVTLFLFLNGLLDVVVNSIRGMGIVTLPTVVTLFGVCGFRLLYLYTYFAGHRSPETLYLCFPLSWSLTLLCQLPIWFYRYRQLINGQE